MNRLGKFSLVDLLAVTAQTFRIIDTLRTVFPALDDELLPFFLRFGRADRPLLQFWEPLFQMQGLPPREIPDPERG